MEADEARQNASARRNRALVVAGTLLFMLAMIVVAAPSMRSRFEPSDKGLMLIRAAAITTFLLMMGAALLASARTSTGIVISKQWTGWLALAVICVGASYFVALDAATLCWWFTGKAGVPSETKVIVAGYWRGTGCNAPYRVTFAGMREAFCATADFKQQHPVRTPLVISGRATWLGEAFNEISR